MSQFERLLAQHPPVGYQSTLERRRADVTKMLRREHRHFVAEEDSPKISYIEEYYRRQLRSGRRDWKQVERRVHRIPKVSLKPTEKKHILKHLRLYARRIGKVPPLKRKFKVKRRGREIEVYRDNRGRFTRGPHR